MELQGSLLRLPRDIKIVIGLFLLVVSVGFLSALQFVDRTTSGTPSGIEENYLGNEEDPEAVEMKFEKSEKQILNIIHTHMLAMGTLFLVLALLVAATPVTGKLRAILLIEPLISVLFTFGGIYFLWKKVFWMKYVVQISGILMTLSFITSVLLVGYWLFRKRLR